jgi:methylated-DNA-[protein]-cysteine S-methyltransferase
MPKEKVYYSKLNFEAGPFKTIHLYFNDRGITELSFKKSKTPAIVRNSHPVLKTAKKQLQEYFQGKRAAFDCPLDYNGTKFQMQAWKALQDIPFGKAISYSDQAISMKKEGAARAVGNANGKNPIPIIIPCHRVLHKSGGLGGFSAGLAIKQKLLKLEGISFR